MKKEASAKNKKWLWLVIALVAILAAAGVLVAVLLGGGNQNDGDAALNSKLYWNVDKVAFTENAEALETGLSTREREDDGLYHVRLATGGELIEVLVSDARLINYIDTLDALGLVFDADGMVVDAIDPSLFNPEIVREFFVRRVSDTMLTVNSSMAMNGMEMTFDLTTVGVYDVTPTAAQPGMPGVCEIMDTVYVYGDMDGNATDIFITSHADSAEIYWPLDKFYDSTNKVTTRVPDANGVYTIPFAYKGEHVELKSRDKDMVSRIDGASVDRSFALKFDEEGYIIGSISTQMAIRGLRLTDRYHVDSWDGKTFHATGYIGNTIGMEATATLADDCEIYLVCDNGTVKSHIGEKTELQMGDRILCFTDLEGNAKLIYVLNRMVDSPLYYNLDRSYSDTNQETKRVPDEDGYYNIRLLVNGKIKTYRTKNRDLVNRMDAITECAFGLKLRGDIIEKVYNYDSVTSLTVLGFGRFVTDINGTVLTYAKQTDPTNPKNALLSPDTKVYNVTKDMDGTKLGSLTELKKYDKVGIFKFIDGSYQIFVTQRYIPDAKLYYNIDPEFYAKSKITKRTPNDEGYYVIDMACEGKQVQVKTKDIDMASFIDSISKQIVALKVDKDGVVKYAYKPGSVAKGGAVTSSSYYYDKYEEGEYKCYVTTDGEKVANGIKIYKGSKAPGIYNVSYGFEEFMGEKASPLKHDNVLFVIGRMEGNVAYSGFIVERKMDIAMAFKRSQEYNSTTGETTRTPDADGYYVFELLIDGVLKEYKTKDKKLASKVDSYSTAFGVKLNGNIIEGAYNTRAIKGVDYAYVSQFDVTTIEEDQMVFTRNRPTSTNYGEVRTKPVADKIKVYDLSPYAKKWGAETKLKVGDRVVGYLNDEGELAYFYVMYACTRKEGPVSHCDHCDKEVWWEPFLGTVFDEDEIHYYYPTDTTTSKQFVIGGLEKPVVLFRQAGVLNVYDGVTLTGTIDKTGGTLNEMGASKISEQANEMKFPDVADYEAYCPACKKVVNWHGVSNTSRVRAESGDHLFLRTDNKITSESPCIYANPKDYGNESVCVHLNGKTMKAISNIQAMDGVLNIMGTGTVSSTCNSSTNGHSMITVHRADAVVNLYGGTYVSVNRGNDVSVVLDLNGQDVTVQNRIAQVYGKLDIYDTVGGGTISTAIKSADQNGGGFVANDGGVINLHAGTLTMDENAAAVKTGGIVRVVEGGTFNMLGGTITGGKSENGGNVAVSGGVFNMKKGTISGGEVTEFGGNVYVNGGVFNMTGGKLEDGVTTQRGGNVSVMAGDFNLKKGAIYGGQAGNSGGNVYVLNDSRFTMTGGEVAGGQTEGNGGNFRVQSENGKLDANEKQVKSVLTISGGTVSDGVAKNGGNVSTGNHSVFTHDGGKIVGGTATENGGSVISGASTTKLTLGATITDGEVYIDRADTTTLTGKVAIDNLVLKSGITVALDGLKSGAEITMSANGAFAVANENAENYKDYFTPAVADPDKSIFVKDNVLYYAYPPVVHVCPACGGEPVEWIAISDPTMMQAGGHYCLKDDINYSYAVEDNANSFITGAGCLDLYGKNVKVNGGRFLYADGGNVNIVDTVGGSVVSGSFDKGKNGAATIVVYDATLSLYGGTYKAMPDTLEGDSDENTSIIRVRNGKLIMKNGATVDGEGYDKLGTYALVYVGLDSAAPVFEMQGGVIKNGGAAGAVYLGKTSTATISGGTINGKVDALTGTSLTLSGAPQITADGLTCGTGVLVDINGLTAEARIYVNAALNVPFTTAYTGDVDMNQVFSSGLVDCLLSKNDENQYLYAVDSARINPYQAQIDLGITVKEKSAEVKDKFLNATGNVTAVCPVCGTEQTWTPIDSNFTAGSSISGHYYLAYAEPYAYTFASAASGNYYMKASGDLCLNLNGKSLTINTGRFLEETTSKDVNILDTAGTAVITGSFSSTAEYGSAIRISNDNAKLHLFGGTYRKNVTEDGLENAVVVVNKGTLNMYEGATIEGGSNSGGKGGNVELKNNTSVLNMYGGAIIGGSAKNGGNIYVKQVSTLNIAAGFIGGGTASTSGGNIYFDASDTSVPTVSFYGGTVVGDIQAAANVNMTLACKPKILPAAVYNGVPYTATRGLSNSTFDYTNLAEGADVWKGKDMTTSYTYCPTCQEMKEWTTISAPTEMVEGGHYRLKDNITHDAGDGSFLSGKGCIDLNGKNVTITNGTFVSASDAANIKVLDTVGGGQITDSNTP